MQEENQYDAVIIGGGPAGAATAAILGEYGHNVIVLEREKFPRYHIGESLLPFTYHPAAPAHNPQNAPGKNPVPAALREPHPPP